VTESSDAAIAVSLGAKGTSVPKFPLLDSFLLPSFVLLCPGEMPKKRWRNETSGPKANGLRSFRHRF